MKGRESPVVILMADDDEDDCMFVKDAFDESEFAVDLYFVGDGEELMDYLYRRNGHESAQCPDLILLDLNMPKKDGRKALEEIKADGNLRSIPIVILTTSNEEVDIQLCYNMGASSFITKPMTFDELSKTIRTIGLYWFQISSLPPRRKDC